MDTEFVQTELFCLTCDQLSVHVCQYENRRIVCVRCEQCGRMIGPHAEIIAMGIPGNLIYKKTIESSQLPFRNNSIACAQILVKSYREKLLQRIITKPSRLRREMYDDINTFVRSIPLRVITKPIRMAKEMSQINK